MYYLQGGVTGVASAEDNLKIGIILLEEALDILFQSWLQPAERLQQSDPGQSVADRLARLQPSTSEAPRRHHAQRQKAGTADQSSGSKEQEHLCEHHRRPRRDKIRCI